MEWGIQIKSNLYLPITSIIHLISNAGFYLVAASAADGATLPRIMQLANVIQELVSSFTEVGDKVAVGVSWEGKFS